MPKSLAKQPQAIVEPRPVDTSSGGRTMISRAEVARRLGCHLITTYTWQKTIPDFPKPIVKSPGRRAFYEDEVAEYINSRPRVANPEHA